MRLHRALPLASGLTRRPTRAKVGPRMLFPRQQPAESRSAATSDTSADDGPAWSSAAADATSAPTSGAPQMPRIVPILARPTVSAATLDAPGGTGSASAARPTPTRLPQVAAKILIVENEDSNRTLMEKILGLAGYRCISACNGQEALDVFEHERPDIVLTDISMPVMDGLEEVAAIRARPDGARVPIVAVTAHAMSGDREFALREGCTEYLAKPFRPRDLLAVVERLLKEASQ
jgi:CheY-like chemotaxis protein